MPHNHMPHTGGTSTLPANWLENLPKPVAPTNGVAPVNNAAQHTLDFPAHHAAFNPADAAAFIHHHVSDAPVIVPVGSPPVPATPAIA